MLSILIAPASAPQVSVVRPAPPPALKLDEADQHIIEVVREQGPVDVWRLLDMLADEETPPNREARRALRLELWHRLKPLLRHRVLWRLGRKAVSFARPPPAVPSVRRPRTVRARRAMEPRAVRRVEATVPVGAGARLGSTGDAARDATATWRAVQPAAEPDRRGSQDPEGPAPPESAPTPEQISAAARALAELPRGRKRKWTGWLDDQERLWRGRPIILPGGQPAYAYGAVRRRIVWSLEPQRLAAGLDGVWDGWGVLPARRIQVLRNEDARLLGRRKKGVRERRSALKAECARRNGLRPCRPGRRRGRPAKRAAGAVAA